MIVMSAFIGPTPLEPDSKDVFQVTTDCDIAEVYSKPNVTQKSADYDYAHLGVQ